MDANANATIGNKNTSQQKKGNTAKKKSNNALTKGLSLLIFGNVEKEESLHETLPFITLYTDGICKITKNKFSKTAEIRSNNGADVHLFEEILNLFKDSRYLQITTLKDVEIRGKISKYITYTVKGTNLENAKTKLKTLEEEIKSVYERYGITANPLDGEQRLNVIQRQISTSKNNITSTWKKGEISGIRAKKEIASKMKFNDKKTYKLDNVIFSIYTLQILTGNIDENLFAEYFSMENMHMMNMHMQPVNEEKSISNIAKHYELKKKIEKAIANSTSTVAIGQKQNFAKSLKLTEDFTVHGLGINKLLQTVQEANETAYLISFTFAIHVEEIKRFKDIIVTLKETAQKYDCICQCLDFRQEKGLSDMLVVGTSNQYGNRMATTSTLAKIINTMI